MKGLRYDRFYNDFRAAGPDQHRYILERLPVLKSIEDMPELKGYGIDPMDKDNGYTGEIPVFYRASSPEHFRDFHLHMLVNSVKSQVKPNYIFVDKAQGEKKDSRIVTMSFFKKRLTIQYEINKDRIDIAQKGRSIEDRVSPREKNG